MELIHHHICERDIFKLEHKEQKKQSSLENLASKQKTFRIVKEHTLPSRHRAITRGPGRFLQGLASSRLLS
jgi:hypothetical protein